MRFRVKAFSLHLTGSACVLILVLGALYFGWYRWPGWYLAQALHVAVVNGDFPQGRGGIPSVGNGETQAVAIGRPANEKRLTRKCGQLADL